jgi:hypothetical protein
MMVTPVPNAPEEVLKVGEQKTLTPTWKDVEGTKAEMPVPDTSGARVKWTVIPLGLVELEPNVPEGISALITAVAPGTCTVTATLVNGLVSAEIHVRVISEGAVSGEMKVSDE